MTETSDVAAASRAMVSIWPNAGDAISYASHQNAYPILYSLRLFYDGAEPLEGLELRVSSTPALCRPRVWAIDRLHPNATFDMPKAQLRIELDGAALKGLSEAVRGELIFELAKRGQTIAEARAPVRFLTESEWGGLAATPELIAAFSLPNAPAVARLLKAASKAMEKSGIAGGINGYLSNDRKRAWEIGSAIWSAVQARKLSYAVPPASFEIVGQKVRTPRRILSEGLATCLDSTLLFAAALEQAGLDPVIGFTRGHALPGFWLRPTGFRRAVLDDPERIRKEIDLGDLVMFESTLATDRSAPRFSDAVAAGRAQFDAAREDRFERLIDIRCTRLQGVRPIDDPTAPAAEPASEGPAGPVELAPVLPLALPAKSAAFNRRIRRWCAKLLDLSRRNRLLNLPNGDTVLPIVLAAPDETLDLMHKALAAERPIALTPAPAQLGLGPRWDDAAAASKQAFAAELIARGELLADCAEADLHKRLVSLYRRARQAQQESGANTVYLALGMMRWTDAETGKSARAPLVLAPVRLTRKGAQGPVRLRVVDDEIRVNDTLMELLRQTAGVRVAPIQAAAKDQGAGLLKRVFQAARAAVRDHPGYELEESAAIASFSFAKYWMWRDLGQLEQRVAQNRLIRHLVETPADAYAHAQPIPSVDALDAAFAPKDDHCVLPADASQRRAVLAASRNQDFVLIGPPGTGKSQTIVNIIAQCMAEGRSVLFVSAKTAALDVVRRRLREVGLGDLCLEIHAAKAEKQAVLAQLRRALEAADDAGAGSGALDRDIDRVLALRAELGGFRDALHAPQDSGMTAYGAISAVLAANGARPPIVWRAERPHAAAELEEMRRTLRRIDAATVRLGPIAAHPLRPIARAVWTEAAATEIEAAARATLAAVPAFRSALAGAAPALPKILVDRGRAGQSAAAWLARAELAPNAPWTRLALNPRLDAIIEAAAEARAALAAAERAAQPVKERFHSAAWTRLNVGALAAEARAAPSAGWPRRAWLERRVDRSLKRHARGPVDVARDLPGLLRAWEAAQTAAGFGALTRDTLDLYAGARTDWAALDAALADARRFRDVIRDAAGDGIEEMRLRRLIETRLIAKRATKRPQIAQDRVRLSALVEAATRLEAALSRFEAAAERPLAVAREPAWLEGLEAALAGVLGAAPSLREWCAWRALRAEALSRDLAPVIEGIETGAVDPGAASSSFARAFQDWWSSRAIDASPALRGFAASTRQVAVAELGELSAAVRRGRRGRVRASCLARRPARDALGADADRALGVLTNELEKKKGGRTVRALLSAVRPVLPRLTPCVLMSPMSVAQHLAGGDALFDVVIFDEASQIATADAVGAIARGRQTIIVGDPKQLPPTSFFERQDLDADAGGGDEDQESILDECRAANLPTLSLDWHYRSRDESLIAFSNRLYYGGGLITFPSPRAGDRRVRLQPTPGVYDKGASRTNPIEARAVVDALIGRLRADLASGATTSYGVITFNAEQQRRIEDLIDDALRAEPALEARFGEDAAEPVIVKNLESIQGDERDVIFFSTTYGPDPDGALSLNFGPLNQAGGERRLNVAVTRARSELVVFSSLAAADIDLHRTGAQGVRDLRRFLDYAERGAAALPVAARRADRAPDAFAAVIAEALAARGWRVDLDLGLSDARIDLAVRDPAAPSRHCAAILCDGPNWARCAGVLDREHIRTHALESLGWAVRREHLLEWRRDPDGAADRLDASLRALAPAASNRGVDDPAEASQLRMVWNAA